MGVVGVLDPIPICEKLGRKRNGILSCRAVESECHIVGCLVPFVLQANKTPRYGNEGAGMGSVTNCLM